MGGHTLSMEVESSIEASRILYDTNKHLTTMGLFLDKATIQPTNHLTFLINARWSK